MKRLLLALLLFSSPVLAEKERIYYVHSRPPSSYSGTIGDDVFYYFTNSAVSASKDGYDMRIDGACFMKNEVPAKIVKDCIMKTPNIYWCSEAVIQEAKKVQTPSPRNYSGYGICTGNGWVFK